MKLISGNFGGRILKTVKDEGLRPAMARTREAVFSMLEARGLEWPSTSVLDLFAGCGSLGLEALSRGALTANFVENGRKPFECLAENVQSLGLDGAARLIKMDVRKFLRQTLTSPYNLIFLDPPYRRNYAQACINAIANGMWLASGGILVAELEKELEIVSPAGFTAEEIRTFGQTNIHTWIKS